VGPACCAVFNPERIAAVEACRCRSRRAQPDSVIAGVSGGPAAGRDGSDFTHEAHPVLAV
jgi:hypothetical protein